MNDQRLAKTVTARNDWR